MALRLRAWFNRIAGFSVAALDQMEGIMTSYKKNVVNAEPVGAYVNDSIMVTSGAIVTEDGDEARRIALNARTNYFGSQLYHTTTPSPIPRVFPTGRSWCLPRRRRASTTGSAPGRSVVTPTTPSSSAAGGRAPAPTSCPSGSGP